VSGPLGLPFDEVWLIDFEYVAPDGEQPDPVCMVAKELGTGRLVRLWADQLGPTPPFRTDAGVLFVAYMAAAEWSCFLQLGWPIPERCLDLYVEFLAETNGVGSPSGSGLLGALVHHGIPGITKGEKDAWRERIIAGFPFTATEAAGILDYCQSDVDVLGPLLEHMLVGIRARPSGLGRALLRGRYMAAIARMEAVGVPVDLPVLEEIRAHWSDIKLGLIADVDVDFGVYDGGTFRQWKFKDYLDRRGIPWPRLEGGGLALDGDTFRDMSKTYPELLGLQQLRTSLGELRLESLAVGADGRNRVSLMPFRARTGRNQPSNSRFVFGPAKWIRGLITPPPGLALAYLDFSSQEVHIGARLSGDPAMCAAVDSGDPYLAFALAAGLAPPGATKQTHRDVRDVCKTVVLGTGYGMRAQTLSYRVGRHVVEARDILRRLEQTWPTYFAWCAANQARAQLSLGMETVFGWPLRVPETASANSLLNFPMQANGAEMLRLACCLATESGIEVCAPVHDALLIQAPVESIDEAVAMTSRCMREAASAVLDGPSVPVGIDQILLPGERFSDDRGVDMWRRVCRLSGVAA
jgi:hypothetical protein